ncbi:MAG: hypothetical protein C4518_07565 [Desulfobacteraceae bacterium]|nr:MAG: hypothetical protein C4518_07565 [Desulfobacteraceae bacterium]
MVKSFFVCGVLVSLLAGSAFAGAWPREKGAWYHQLTLNTYTADENFDDDGDRAAFSNNGEFRDKNMSYYLEYGLLEDLTVTGSLPYKWLEYEDDSVTNKTDGVSDLEIGLKYRLCSLASGVCSLQTSIKIPEAYDMADAVPLGNGQYDYEARLLYGRSLYPHFPGYVNVEAGYRFRAEAPADEFKYLVEAGVDFTTKFYGRVKLDGTKGMNNADGSETNTDNPTITYDYDLGKLDVALGWKIVPDWGMEVGYRPEIYGKNTAAGVNWSLALIYQMN